MLRDDGALTYDGLSKSEGKVQRLMLEGKKWWVGFDTGGWTEPRLHKWHHVQPDTWERIIEDAIDSVDGGPTIAALVDRCRALAREGA